MPRKLHHFTVTVTKAGKELVRETVQAPGEADARLKVLNAHRFTSLFDSEISVTVERTHA